ncbi:hypothetical protein CMUS01_07810 [Colletotrichum musicola]|uniref:Uncharacterized protein n=1 Tax=Colletotrichum musicola TaxID=2175873 RepID=A0A8H6NEW2_9PEZI|nr:hypothetical protein CMUS01_07810 [Colletotrichum musicola]
MEYKYQPTLQPCHSSIPHVFNLFRSDEVWPGTPRTTRELLSSSDQHTVHQHITCQLSPPCTSRNSETINRDKCDIILDNGADSTAQRSAQLSLALKITMMISLLALTSAVSFITWLWWAPRDSLLWRSWVLTENRTQLSITIAALVIRAAVGLLASIATPMIASVAVERHGVSLQSVAQLSITRYASSGPLALGTVVLKDPILDITARSIIVLLILTTLPVQFASSLLMLDLEGRPNIKSLPKIVPTFWAPGFSIESLDWQRSPVLAHTFAEYSEPAKPVDGVDDTGITIRALLPIPQQKTRKKLRDFQGMARVIDSRVLCMRPDILGVQHCEDPYIEALSICIEARLNEDILRSIGFELERQDDNDGTLSATSRTEQIIDWENGNYSFNTNTILGQFGILNVSSTQSEDFHGLRIDPESLEKSLSEGPYQFKLKDFLDASSLGKDSLPLGDVVFCSECHPPSNYVVANPVFGQVMDQARRQGFSPARILQALYFTLSGFRYYESINTNTYNSGNARITTFEAAIVPSHFRGYWTLMVILFAFLMTFTLTVTLFLETRYSHPENAWHTIAQISENPELRDVLHEAKFASDDDVKHFINGTKPPAGFLNKADHMYDTFEKYWDMVLSMFKSRTERSKTPRFIVHEGAFVRASGAETDAKSESRDLRRRPGERNHGPETV